MRDSAHAKHFQFPNHLRVVWPLGNGLRVLVGDGIRKNVLMVTRVLVGGDGVACQGKSVCECVGARVTVGVQQKAHLPY